MSRPASIFRSSRVLLPAFIAPAIALAPPIAARAQDPIAARVAAASPDAAVTMRFPSREGVCGDGRGSISLGGATFMRSVDASTRWSASTPCLPGPVHVVLTRRDGQIENVSTTVGDSARRAPSPSTDLGAVDPTEAARYLLGLAARLEGKVAERAILPAVLADRALVWPSLLAIARDSTRDRKRPARSGAAFWLSRFAAAARNGHPGQLVDETDDRPEDEEKGDVRGSAVFALSQLPRHEGIPLLLDVARDHRDPRVRSKAMFWLGQSGDPRALALFEGILARSR